MEINGESGDVAGASWRERIPELLTGYSAENVWNLDWMLLACTSRAWFWEERIFVQGGEEG